MTDRELLELAAKAAGYEWGYEDTGALFVFVPQAREWNPLTDDGDALRLAVKLEINICFGANYVIANDVQNPTVNNANDPYAATRRAIVRAAAEMAKEIK